MSFLLFQSFKILKNVLYVQHALFFPKGVVENEKEGKGRKKLCLFLLYFTLCGAWCRIGN